MYYSKLSNAYNEASGRNIDEKYPTDPGGFAPQRPEFEIVGAFATDPIRVNSIISGDGSTPSSIVTVDTPDPHGLNVGTPIKIRGVSVSDYNISTKVASVLSPTRFTYTLALVPDNLRATPGVSSASITIETDTVTGASPYIFNISLRSVFGMNGMKADGAKATGFRSMVVAQFTAISLQKDDRAFVKYNNENRAYESIPLTIQRGEELSARSSSTNTNRVYHLDPFAIYRPEWSTTHIDIDNDAVMQVVSVFAIGFNQHFAARAGGDASITNSNSNFGQFSLLSEGFKNDAFDKDDQGFITQIISPNNAFNPNLNQTEDIALINLNYQLTKQRSNELNVTNQIYLTGFTNPESKPPNIIQGFRPGANNSDVFFQQTLRPDLYSQQLFEAEIRMVNEALDEDNFIASGSDIAKKVYDVEGIPNNSELRLIGTNGLTTGESIRLLSGNGDLPENIEVNTLYYAIVSNDNQFIQIATSEANAINGINLQIFGGDQLRVESRVNDKSPGELGHPIQYDFGARNWFIHTNPNSEIFRYITGTGDPINPPFGPEPPENEGNELISFFRRKSDNRSLEDKIYRLRYVIPRSTVNSKPPTPGYIIQDSSSTGFRTNDDAVLTDLTVNDYGYDRNNRFIKNCAVVAGGRIECTTERPHQLSVGDKVRILNVESSENPTGSPIQGFNGEFIVLRIGNGSGNNDARIFEYDQTDINGFTRNPGVFTNNTNIRNTLLPRFERKNNQLNLFAYRVEEIQPFVENIRDGVYHLFCVNGANQVPDTFTEFNYNQPIEFFYPQLDQDNIRENPPSTASFANRAPLGRVTINELQNSLTRESLDRLYLTQNENIISTVINSPVSGVGTFISTIEFEREHNFNGVYGLDLTSTGSGYTNGEYSSIPLFSSSGTIWKGATISLEVTGGIINPASVKIDDPGSNYVVGETLTVIDLPGGSGASFEVISGGIEDNTFTGIQVTGGGESNLDTYSYITQIVDTRTISIIRDTSAPGSVEPGMYILPTDVATPIENDNFDPLTEIYRVSVDDNTVFGNKQYGAPGLQRGNSFILFDANGSYSGKFYVDSIEVDAQTPPFGPNAKAVEFKGVAGPIPNIVGGRIIKTGFEDNDASTGAQGENIGVRGVPEFSLGTFYLNEALTGNNSGATTFSVRALDGGLTGSVGDKLYLGRYLQVGSEIMRISAPPTGINGEVITVIRGALGTIVQPHLRNSKIKTISPYALELRRPSILRASGHTFEYIGYGPGNYSVALPQLQVRQLPEDEIYLVQAQEIDAGQVVYTGMSDNGDFYIGNIKFSATSGTQVTFDVPIPTIAGQLASANNVVFDEVIVNRRLQVLGGETQEVLSEFNGPVKFTNDVSFNAEVVINDLTVGGEVEITNLDPAVQNPDGSIDAPLLVAGGLGVGKNAIIRTDLDVNRNIDVGGISTFTGNATFENDLTVEGTISTNNITIFESTDGFELATNQTNTSDILVGSGNTDVNVIFQTTKPATGEGGDDVGAADAGVDIKGGLVVRDVVIAKEFRGDGLGAGPGSIVLWAGDINNPPKNYYVCDGQSYSVAGNPKLFEAIGYTFGGVPGSNFFNVPDLRNRFIVGSGEDYATGDTGGADSINLTVAQLASHSHGPASPVGGTTGSNLGEHNHGTDPSSVNDANASHDHVAGAPGAPNAGFSGSANAPHSHVAGAPGSTNDNLSGDSNAPHSHVGGTPGNPGQSGGGGSHNHPINDPGHSHQGNRPNLENPTFIIGNYGDGEANQFRRITNPAPSNISIEPVGNHRHSVQIQGANAPHRHTVQIRGADASHRHPVQIRTDNAPHTHPLTLTIEPQNLAHTHTIDNTGEGSAIENRPRYFAMAYIIQYK